LREHDDYLVTYLPLHVQLAAQGFGTNALGFIADALWLFHPGGG
jgi:hypothetical protein